MPGLSFLSKKSWHTSTIKNVEKVWVAEQKAEQEQKKLVELQKQLQEERQIQELRQLQVQHGQNIRNVDSSLDWMYEGPSASSIKQQQSEEFLLGKIYKPQENNTFDLSVPVQLSSKKSDKWMEKVSHKNDIFARMHEDPMVAIKQAEKQKRDAVIHNPIKMEKIRQKISQDLEDHRTEKDRKKKAKKEKKRMKKEEKKAKKEKKSHKDSRVEIEKVEAGSSSSSESSESESDREAPAPPREREDRKPVANEKSTRDDSRDRKPRTQDVSPPRRAGARDSRDRSDRFRRDSRSRSPEANRKRESSRSPPRRKRERSPDSVDSRKQNRHRNDSRDRNSKRSDSRDRRREPKRDSRSREQPLPNKVTKETAADQERGEKRYGLINNGSKTDENRGYLGPNPDLLKKKEDLKQKEMQERMNRKREDVKTLTAEEREKRLQEMLQDAQAVDSKRLAQLQTHDSNQDKDDDHTGKAQFLSSMRTEVYQAAAESGLKDRLDQNRYYRQGAADLEGPSNFLRKP